MLIGYESNSNPTHEHAMWKQDLGTRVPENYQTELSWRQRCHTDRLIGVSELNRWPNGWGADH